MDDKGIKDLTESLKGGMDTTDFINIKKKINYMADNFYLLTKPPSKYRREPKEEEYWRYYLYVQKQKTLYTGPEKKENIRAFLDTLIKASPKGIELARDFFAPLETEYEKIIDTSMEYLIPWFEGYVKTMEDELKGGIDNFTEISEKMSKLSSLLEETGPGWPSATLERMWNYLISEAKFERIITDTLGAVLKRQFYLGRIQDTVEARVEEAVKDIEFQKPFISPTGIEAIPKYFKEELTSANWRKILVEELFQARGPGASDIQRDFVKKLIGEEKGFSKKSLTEALDKFLGMKKGEVEKFAKTFGIMPREEGEKEKPRFESFFKWFLRQHPLKKGELIPAHVLWSAKIDLAQEIGSYIKTDLLLTIPEEFTDEFIKELEEKYDAKIPPKAKELVESVVKELILVELKKKGRELRRDEIKYLGTEIAKKIIGFALVPAGATKEVAEKLITFPNILKFLELLPSLTPEEMEEKVEESVESIKEHKLRSSIETIVGELGEPFEDLSKELLESIKEIPREKFTKEFSTLFSFLADLLSKSKATHANTDVISGMMKEFLTKLSNRIYGSD